MRALTRWSITVPAALAGLLALTPAAVATTAAGTTVTAPAGATGGRRELPH